MTEACQPMRAKAEALTALHSKPASAIHGLVTSFAAFGMAAINAEDWRFLLPGLLMVPFALVRLWRMYEFQRRGIEVRSLSAWERSFFVCSVIIALSHGLFVLQAMLLTNHVFIISLSVGLCLAQMVGVVARNFASSSLVSAQALAMGIPCAIGWWMHPNPWFGVTAIFFVPFFLSARSLAAGIRNLLEGQRDALETIRRVAIRDSLTGVLNRKGFYEKLSEEQSQPDRGHYIAVLVDIDYFKAVNDSYGHSVGDALLVQIARRLERIEHEGLTVARLAGDEFAILARSHEPQSEMENICGRVLECFDDLFNCRGVYLSVKASVGAAAVKHADAQNSVIVYADLALYETKELGRDGYHIYRDEMQGKFERREILRRDLRQAVAAGELRLVYQPMGDIDTGAITTCEALMRWDHPTLGTISPNEFIPLAETADIVSEFTRWAVETAVAECVHWPSTVGVSVNLSACDLRRRDIVNTVFDVLIRYGLAPHRLTMEMTETALAEEPLMTRQVLHGLRALGVKTALDDFGTGYANFGYLIDYEFDKLKLDRSLINQVSEGSRARVLIAGLARTAQDLGLTIIAEGVERRKQFDTLRSLESIDTIQGWLLSRPIQSGQDIRTYLAHPFFDPERISEETDETISLQA
ncbi:bifunctional diguanylate cyclase/phosphodiesterase [Notoacmeibacter sp. MSK16QG-6]|uniref:putative bifunctional diguanylate cyclase/phosphodiesterase n=1 Tax=Notoacmeibacter sp. MSK16QG-6 TaxID=2957982 RepID=UPI0020A07F32|nr:EAL domain-containing protein [Notoacmeibacter sp. MSK16QG-6]MCP1197810.1 EAL domain-containing protein [Notoacmeibacter sp. MSK16QG-6]